MVIETRSAPSSDADKTAERWVLVAYLAFLACVAMAGGSWQVDATGQPLVRLAALLLMAVLVLRPGRVDVRPLKQAIWFITACAVVIAMQLVPLPPEVWTRLPGHARYAVAAIAAGEAQPWRPITLTPDRSWNALFALLPPLAVCAAMARLHSGCRQVVLSAYALITATSAVLGLVQISGGLGALGLPATYAPHAAAGLFSNRNHQALLLCCGIPILGLCAVLCSKRPKRTWSGSAVAVLVIAFVVIMIPFTGSRAGVALGLLSLALTFALLWHVLRRATDRRSCRAQVTGLVVATAVTLALIGVAVASGRAAAVQRVLHLHPADEMRVRIMPALWGMIREYWPVGAGFGSFSQVYRGVEPFDGLALTYVVHAHDDYLQLVLEGGLPGAALLMLFVGWWARASLTLWWRHDDELISLGRLGSGLLLLMMIASLFDYPLRTPMMMVLAMQCACWMLFAIVSNKIYR